MTRGNQQTGTNEPHLVMIAIGGNPMNTQQGMLLIAVRGEYRQSGEDLLPCAGRESREPKIAAIYLERGRFALNMRALEFLFEGLNNQEYRWWAIVKEDAMRKFGLNGQRTVAYCTRYVNAEEYKSFVTPSALFDELLTRGMVESDFIKQHPFDEILKRPFNEIIK